MPASKDTPPEPTSTEDSPKPYRRYPSNFDWTTAILLILGVAIVLAFVGFRLVPRMF